MSTVIDEAVLEDRPEVDLSVLAASLQIERESPIVLSLDIGTSGVRAALFDGRGEKIENLIDTPASEVSAELGGGLDADADALVGLVKNSLNFAIGNLSIFASRVDYVAFSCFWHSLVGVDKEGKAVTPLFGWADTRAAGAVAELQSRFDEAAVHARTGCRFHPSYWPAKLLWLKKERGELFRKARRWLSFSDYLSLRMFGDTTTSVSMASATGLLDQRTCEWDHELVAELDLSVEQLPPIARAGEGIKFQPEGIISNLPPLEGAMWFPAIGDGAANNIGASCVSADRAALMIGTSGAMRALFAGIPPNSMRPELFCYRADRDRIVVGGALSDGGGLWQWMNQTLVGLYADPEIESTLNAMEPDAHGLTVLPFWFGERAPGWSSSARGSIVGFTSQTKPVEILRAGMEAIGYRFAALAGALGAVVPKAAIIGTGNALLSSPAWAQILADVLGQQIELSTTREASTRGAALLALEAVGKIDSLETIDPEPGAVYEPNIARHAIYAQAMERQQELYDKLIK
jgi:gluconokinase